jgi:cytochrome b subunit of formate dehydrogenase
MTTPREAKNASSAQRRAATFSEEEAMAHITLVTGTTTRQRPTARAYVVRPRRRPLKQRLLFIAIALAIVLLALAGWATQALRTAT